MKIEHPIILHGEMFGVQITHQGLGDDCTCVILSEDDDNWTEHGTAFSSFWLDDLITQLKAAKAVIKAN